MPSTKVILINNSAGRKKYGTTNWKKIITAVNGLIAADKKRGVESKIYKIDSASQMKTVGGKQVTKRTSARQTKRAIDAIFEKNHPHYLMIVGGPDLIPHVTMRNPIPKNEDAQEDANVPSDLPYACDQPYALDVEKYKGPTRVLGRLPDITGVNDPAYLISLLKTATNWKTRPKSAYKNYFGLTAKVWRKSTRANIKKLFSSVKKLEIAPPDLLPWTKTQLSPRMHFINCHGAEIDHRFFGDDDVTVPEPTAHASDQLEGVTEGTVVAAECCYGMELYKKPAHIPMPICNQYLEKKAYGYLGSTTIAYGFPDSLGYADHLCLYFLQNVQQGASLGRALLEARQKFITEYEPLDPVALKTLAQFNLLGDPSIHPIKKSKTAKKSTRKKTRVVKKKSKSLAKIGAAALARTDALSSLMFMPEFTAKSLMMPKTKILADRSQRRQRLYDQGIKLETSTVAVDSADRHRVSADVRNQMMAHVTQKSAKISIAAFDMAKMDTEKVTALKQSKSVISRKQKDFNTRVVVAVMSPQKKNRNTPTAKNKAAPASPRIIKTRLLVAKQQNGTIQSVKECVAR
jgi:hypothetical protein